MADKQGTRASIAAGPGLAISWYTAKMEKHMKRILALMAILTVVAFIAAAAPSKSSRSKPAFGA